MIYDAFLLHSIGRFLIVASFLCAGLCNPDARADQGPHRPHGGARNAIPAVAFWTGQGLLFMGCALLIVGWHADIGALLLIVFTGRGDFDISSLLAKPETQRNLSRIMF
jgi:uncharacterized membrane protein YphA (DoxX/SURF4 family)